MRMGLLLLEALLTPVVALGVVLAFACSGRRGRLKGLADELPERLGTLRDLARDRLKGRRVWWFHAASAGEVAGLEPLLARLAARVDAPAFLLTTTTTVGRDAARRLPQVSWAQLAPLDAWPLVARFLASVKPERLILTETELWPTTILLAARKGLRPSLVNARLTERSLSWLLRALPILRPAFASLEVIGVQDDLEAARFLRLGVPARRIRVTGNCKYDRGAPPGETGETNERLKNLGWADAAVFVAGSTHPGEEDAVLAGFLQARARLPPLKLVLAPRHPERAAETWKALKDASLRAVRWSRLGPGGSGLPDAEALLVDAMGVLPSLYARAGVAFVGGTLVPIGGHNLLEPALASVPVLFGPHTSHVEQAARLLRREGGGFLVGDATALGERLVRLFADPEARRTGGRKACEVAARMRGAADRTADILGDLDA